MAGPGGNEINVRIVGVGDAQATKANIERTLGNLEVEASLDVSKSSMAAARKSVESFFKTKPVGVAASLTITNAGINSFLRDVRTRLAGRSVSVPASLSITKSSIDSFLRDTQAEVNARGGVEARVTLASRKGDIESGLRGVRAEVTRVTFAKPIEARGVIVFSRSSIRSSVAEARAYARTLSAANPIRVTSSAASGSAGDVAAAAGASRTLSSNLSSADNSLARIVGRAPSLADSLNNASLYANRFLTTLTRISIQGLFAASSLAILGVAGALRQVNETNTELVKSGGILAFDQLGAKAFAAEGSIRSYLATTRDLSKELRGITQQVAISTVFDTPEVAKATRAMAQAGLGIQGIRDGLEGVAQFAQNEDIDIARAANLLIGDVRSLGVATNQVGKYVDTLSDKITLSANRSTTSAEELAEAFGNRAAPAISRFYDNTAEGINKAANETLVLLELLGNTNIRGRTAGEQLSIMARFISQGYAKNRDAWHQVGIEIEDAQGKSQDFTKTVFQLGELWDKMSKAQGPAAAQEFFRANLGLVERSNAALRQILPQIRTIGIASINEMKRVLDAADGIRDAQARALRDTLAFQTEELGNTFWVLLQNGVEGTADSFKDAFKVLNDETGNGERSLKRLTSRFNAVGDSVKRRFADPFKESVNNGQALVGLDKIVASIGVTIEGVGRSWETFRRNAYGDSDVSFFSALGDTSLKAAELFSNVLNTIAAGAGRVFAILDRYPGIVGVLVKISVATIGINAAFGSLLRPAALVSGTLAGFAGISTKIDGTAKSVDGLTKSISGLVKVQNTSAGLESIGRVAGSSSFSEQFMPGNVLANVKRDNAQASMDAAIELARSRKNLDSLGREVSRVMGELRLADEFSRANRQQEFLLGDLRRITAEKRLQASLDAAAAYSQDVAARKSAAQSAALRDFIGSRKSSGASGGMLAGILGKDAVKIVSGIGASINGMVPSVLRLVRVGAGIGTFLTVAFGAASGVNNSLKAATRGSLGLLDVVKGIAQPFLSVFDIAKGILVALKSIGEFIGGSFIATIASAADIARSIVTLDFSGLGTRLKEVWSSVLDGLKDNTVRFGISVADTINRFLPKSVEIDTSKMKQSLREISSEAKKTSDVFGGIELDDTSESYATQLKDTIERGKVLGFTLDNLSRSFDDVTRQQKNSAFIIKNVLNGSLGDLSDGAASASRESEDLGIRMDALTKFASNSKRALGFLAGAFQDSKIDAYELAGGIDNLRAIGNDAIDGNKKSEKSYIQLFKAAAAAQLLFERQSIILDLNQKKRDLDATKRFKDNIDRFDISDAIDDVTRRAIDSLELVATAQDAMSSAGDKVTASLERMSTAQFAIVSAGIINKIKSLPEGYRGTTREVETLSRAMTSFDKVIEAQRSEVDKLTDSFNSLQNVQLLGTSAYNKQLADLTQQQRVLERQRLILERSGAVVDGDQVDARVRAIDEQLKKIQSDQRLATLDFEIATEPQKQALNEFFSPVQELSYDAIISQANNLRSSIQGLQKDLTEKENLREHLQGVIDANADKFVDVGTEIVNGIKTGMDSARGEAVKSADTTANEIVKRTKSVLKIASPSIVMTGIGRDVAFGLRDGINNNIASVVSAMSSATSTLVNSAWKESYQADLEDSGRKYLEALESGMDKYQYKELKTYFDKLNKWIVDHKGPLDYDAKMLTPAGEAIMSGLHRGLQSGESKVKSFILGLNGMIAEGVTSGQIKRDLGGFFATFSPSLNEETGRIGFSAVSPLNTKGGVAAIFDHLKKYGRDTPTGPGFVDPSTYSSLHKAHSFKDMIAMSRVLAKKFDIKNLLWKEGHSKTTSSGNISDHWVGAATDFGDGGVPKKNMNAFWQLLLDSRGEGWIKQAIYRDQVINGSKLGSYFGNDHYDHIHLAWKTVKDMVAGTDAYFNSVEVGGPKNLYMWGFAEEVKKAILQASKKTFVDPLLLAAIARQESGGVHSRNGRLTGSPAGAQGLMQLMPSTAKALGVDYTNLYSNALGGAKYIAAQLKEYKNIGEALRAYNAGPGNRNAGFRETENYYKAVTKFYEELLKKNRRITERTPTSRYMGGYLNSRQLSWVGERGPELYAPRRSGEVISNDRIDAILRLAESGVVHNNVSGGDTHKTYNVYSNSPDPRVVVALLNTRDDDSTRGLVR